MAHAGRIYTRPRHEPEVAAAQVRAMLAPFFKGGAAGMAAVVDDKPNLPNSGREALALLVERLIEEIDRIDGDADFELECEDEGAECNDEGWDGDREPFLGRPEKDSQASGIGPFSERHHREGGLFEFGGATYDEELV
jgi:hypothetical protein